MGWQQWPDWVAAFTPEWVAAMAEMRSSDAEDVRKVTRRTTTAIGRFRDCIPRSPRRPWTDDRTDTDLRTPELTHPEGHASFAGRSFI